MYNNLAIDVNNCKVALYIRLSQEDRNKKYESDSESIINQRDVLNKYCIDNQMHVVDEYVDDGYSGTTFERPAFQRMIEDIENGRINCVIVKDLSRFGRDHIMSGFYLEIYFPEKGVRFISLLDSYDNGKNQASNDTSTFILTFNDWYSKQNSIKIRNVLDAKRRDGKFVGSMPSFGYMRDPNDKGHLIPDPRTAPIVKQIFDWYEEGIGSSEITTRLNEMNIPTPSAYKDIKLSSRLIMKDTWTISSVRKILKNRIYTGDMIQHTQMKVSYKSKKKVTLDESMWFVVENTHEPLIDKDRFFFLQTRVENKAKVRKINREKRLFENLIYCEECGNQLGVMYRKNHDYWTVNCNRYARDPKRAMCSPHFFPYEYLEEQLLERIIPQFQVFVDALNIDELNKEIKESLKKRSTNIKTIKTDYAGRKKILLSQLQSLYDDKCNGDISMNMYQMLSSAIEEELVEIEKKLELENKTKRVEEYKKKKEKEYFEQIKQLLDLKKPNRELMLAVIDRINITSDREITIKYKYEFIPDEVFYYKEKEGPRNPYGVRGKNHSTTDNKNN